MQLMRLNQEKIVELTSHRKTNLLTSKTTNFVITSHERRISLINSTRVDCDLCAVLRPIRQPHWFGHWLDCHLCAVLRPHQTTKLVWSGTPIGPVLFITDDG